eukprot:3118815-Ditylum_brightwellii.AAC.1
MSFSPFSCIGSACNGLIMVISQKAGAFLLTLRPSLIVSDITRKFAMERRLVCVRELCLGLVFATFSSPFSLTFWGHGWCQRRQDGCGLWGTQLLDQHKDSSLCMRLGRNFFRWKQEKFSKKVEKPMHFIIIIFVLTTAIIPL